MHPCLMLTRNNLELTKKAVASASDQWILTTVYVGDNGSTDGTKQWLLGWESHTWWSWDYNLGVSAGWNIGLGHLFSRKDVQQVLVVGNDTILPEWFYAELLNYDVPFVTGIAVDDMEAISKPAQRMPLTPNPDFSAFLIRREAWAKIGPFNEKMYLYSSDQDYHVRGHRLGVGMFKANVPYFHQRSSTLNNASPQEQAVIRAQADADRATFRSIYGCNAPSPEYDALFK